MKDFYSILDLPRRLVLSPEEVESAWRARNADSEEASHDAVEWNEARSVLSDDVLRLEHWLSLQNPSLEANRSIDPALMDLFSLIGPAIASAEEVIKKQHSATTALAKALITREAISAQLAIQEMLQKVNEAKSKLIERFPEFEDRGSHDGFESANRTLGQLKFLKRWESQCQEKLLGLIHS